MSKFLAVFGFIMFIILTALCEALAFMFALKHLFKLQIELDVYTVMSALIILGLFHSRVYVRTKEN